MKAESNIKVQTHKTNVLRWDEEHSNTLSLKICAQFVSPPDNKRRIQLQGSLFTCSPPSGAVDSFSCWPWVFSCFLQRRHNSLATYSKISSSSRSTTSSGRSTTGSGTSSDLDRAQTQNSEQLVIISCFDSWPSFAWIWTIWFGSTCKTYALQWICIQRRTSCLIWFDLIWNLQTKLMLSPGKDKLFPDDCGRQDDGKGKLCFGDPELCRQSEHFIIYQWTHFSNGPISPRPPPCMPNRQYGPFLEIEIDICSPYYRVKLSAQRCHLIWTDAMMDVDNDEDDQSKTDNL